MWAMAFQVLALVEFVYVCVYVRSEVVAAKAGWMLFHAPVDATSSIQPSEPRGGRERASERRRTVYTREQSKLNRNN